MNTFEPILIKASAGTGKTFRLTNRFIELLIAGEDPENILATTFSVKAAGEIRERVLQRVAKAAISEEGAKKLSNELEKKISMSDAQDILRSLISKQHRLNIGTLDSFFHKILSSFSLELGVCPNWKLDTLTQQEFNAEVVKKLCRAEDISALVYLLRDTEFKTSFIDDVSKSFEKWYDVFRQVDPEAWHWIKLKKRFNNKDRELLKNRLIDLRENYIPNHRSWIPAVNKDIESLEESDFVIKGIYGKILNFEFTYCTMPISARWLSVYIDYISYKLSFILEKLKLKNESTYKLLSLFDTEYKNLRYITETLSFFDITDILQKASFREDVEYIYYRLDTRIRHLLLDEFQDTSFFQWRVIEPIAREILAQSGLERSFFCVGDVKQAIYGWRGGVSSIFETLTKRWDFLNVIEENESYRCSQPVLDCVNTVFSSLYKVCDYFGFNLSSLDDLYKNIPFTLDEDKEAWKTYMENYKKSKCIPSFQIIPDALKHWQDSFKKHISKCNEPDLGYVNFTILPKEEDDSDEDLYHKIYQTVQDIITRHPNYKIGILVRSNKVISDIVQVFDEKSSSLKVSVEGKSLLIDFPIARACLAFLHLLDHPADTISAFHIATTPLGDVLDLHDWHEKDFSERCLNWRKEISEIGFGEFFFNIARKLTDKCSEQEIEILHKIAEIGFSYSDWTNSRCEEFAKLIENAEIVNIKEANVIIMTIHKSKGLEFDAVILPELKSYLIENRNNGAKDLLVLHDDMLSAVAVSHEETNLEYTEPTINNMIYENQTNKLSESLSILYVAMTRAKRELYLLSENIDYNKDGGLSFYYASLLYSVLGRKVVDTDNESETCIKTGVVYECGNKDYVLEKDRLENSFNETVEDHKIGIIPFGQKDIAWKRKFPRMQTNKPSKLEGRGFVSLNNLLSTRSISAINIGSLVHSMMQSIGWLDDIQDRASECLYDEDMVAEVIKRLNCSEEEITGAKSIFEKAIKMENVISALSRKQYGDNCSLELFREQRFSVRDSKTSILSGAFDRLVAVSVGGKVVKGDVIDFKSDKIESKDMLSEKAEYYKPQLLAYRTATAKFLNIPEENVSLRLLFIRSGDVISF